MDYPRGMIPRVEVQRSHRKFVEAAKPDLVMMKITHARRLMRREETFADYFGHDETSVITTTTIRDTPLNLLHWDHEWEIIEEMEPEYHIPTDYSDYTNQSAEERQENIQKCMEGTAWMMNKVENSSIDTEVVPLLKGISTEERTICYNAYDQLDRDCAALYATRYFTAGAGNNINQLVSDVRDINAETDVDVLLIGLLAPNYLQRLPSNVVAAAGQKQWRVNVTPRDSTDSEIKQNYEEVVERVEPAIPGTAATPD